MVLEKAIAVMLSDEAKADPSYDYIDGDVGLVKDGHHGKLQGAGLAGRVVEMVAGRPYLNNSNFGKGFEASVWQPVKKALDEGRAVCVSLRRNAGQGESPAREPVCVYILSEWRENRGEKEARENHGERVTGDNSKACVTPPPYE